MTTHYAPAVHFAIPSVLLLGALLFVLYLGTSGHSESFGYQYSGLPSYQQMVETVFAGGAP
jgi:hypothetical protein